MEIIFKIIGGLSVFYGISCFIQSFREQDSIEHLRQYGIRENPQTTSNRLLLMATFFIIIGLIPFFYKLDFFK